MSGIPVSMTFYVGQTPHQQAVKLIAQPKAGGGFLYDLEKEAANQRDDTVRLFDLTDDVLDGIAKAHAAIKRFGEGA